MSEDAANQGMGRDPDLAELKEEVRQLRDGLAVVVESLINMRNSIVEIRDDDDGRE